MRIQIERPQQRRIRILLPNGLLMNRLTAFLIARAQKKSAKNKNDASSDEPILTARQMYALFREIKRLKKTLPPDWNLVEVESTDGENVIVRF
ncbi:MAG: hypothetical protein IJX28_05890 [Clostridia bacterium]|nr:hypothetical protein [Clostridia bacterium]